MFPYCWDVHRANVLESGDPSFPQLTVSPHSMDSMLPSGEGNYVLHQGSTMRSCLRLGPLPQLFRGPCCHILQK